MIELVTFGRVELRRDGADVRSVLSQPKRLALLVYLRLAAPGGFVARERLLGLFWPESDAERARNALRQSLHFLRRSLGDAVVVSRGEREVGVDPALLACDAALFREHLAADAVEAAAELYRGEFLPGFFVDDAPELERWIEEERASLARAAAAAAGAASERQAAAGEQAAAVLWARRAVLLAPLEEAAAQRLMRQLAQGGDRAGALQAFQELERRLEEELRVRPDAATSALAHTIRTQAPSPTPAVPPPAVSPPAVSPPSVSPPAVSPPAVSPRLFLFVAALVVVALVGWLARPRTPRAAVTPAIAVLPLANLSGDPANDYFSDGLAEELLNVLARVPGLRVAARTSSFAFRDQAVPIDSIGRALGVTHVLEGSVRSSGNVVRVTAQLIEARTGFHAWSETYERPMGDILALQDEISAAIARRLQVDLAGNFWGAAERETRDPEAYRLLLRALHTFRTPSPESYALSATLLQEAVQRDPRYARAYGALANVLIWQAYFGWIDTAPALARADTLARRSLAIAETPEAHLALARLAETQAWSADSADAHFRKALELNPADSRAHQFRALMLARSGRAGEAIAAGLRATELDPLHPGVWSNLAAVYSTLGRSGEALQALERARAVAPRDIIVLTNLANEYGNQGRLEEALGTVQQALALDSTRLNLRGLHVHLLFRAGRQEQALDELRALEQHPEYPRYRLATLYAHTGDDDRVLTLLEQSAALHEPEFIELRAPGSFDALRTHPRFLRLLDSLRARSP